MVENAEFEASARHHGCLDPQPARASNGAIFARGRAKPPSRHGRGLPWRRDAPSRGGGTDGRTIWTLGSSLPRRPPDLTFPSVATMVQDGLGMTGGFRLRRAGGLRRIRLCAGQCQRPDPLGTGDARGRNRRRNLQPDQWTGRTASTCVLFGDGAGALILEAREGSGTPADRGILATDLNSDGPLPRPALCGRRRVDQRLGWRVADAGPRGLPTCR